ncbi:MULTISPECIES: peptidoglycan editing factor PgeF [unclassified Colwellia]|uniref:peptidoglycan editing factor PgeF n=1 Tax=unclassified Colwellia TaxID=196834 RepID=UPI0015F59692|nr:MULTISPECIES: peptidoglycan editing factor PgeF [unclassified Colwellia]MBA6232380.1 peptidoglycan editing factor PgeF [Colwellia sp. MB02u-7]MBA6238237.1 peptidoglycan editing factor PgeF [Colwellia sp. MB02u-11]MBA6254515.1 peptidoglycan editing factor PgeF [Colwellia sp. MB3u-28]MBA6258314.1 peptidoglycan editing factor PgeF [Colwellia sp. MB3u-41]MBA6300987.1 peptidoglycan editing factor PgeF [Colwellia sp. MB3u-22]
MRIQNLTQQTTIYNSLYNVEWPVQNVLAFTTTRLVPQQKTLSFNHSHSSAYDQFNLGKHVGDDLEHVNKNRASLLAYLPSNTKIQWLEQVHGNKVVTVESHSITPLVADAAITRQKNIALAVMTADCLPILLTSIDGNEIAAIHGGWKPLAKNIIAHTLDNMKTANENVIAWLGPCIGQSVFEVGEEVKIVFERQSEKFSLAFVPAEQSVLPKTEGNNKYLANLAMIAKIQLNALGINKVYHLNHCTYSDEQQYFSYRRDSITGRMVSIICRN